MSRAICHSGPRKSLLLPGIHTHPASFYEPEDDGVYRLGAEGSFATSHMPLPTPKGRQKDVLYLPAQGHVVVLGTAGSGKTTLAILRSAYLAAPSTDHSGRTLLVTFNNALVTYLRHLNVGEAVQNVVVETYHKFGRGYLSHRGKMPGYNLICQGQQLKGLIAQAVLDVSASYNPHPFFARPTQFFGDEIRWLAQNGISSSKDYEETERVGRGVTRIDMGLRKVMFQILERYRELREKAAKLYDWDDIASAVRNELDQDAEERRYRHIVIDEGQDFSPEMLRSLVGAVPANGSLTFFGDVAQQIYGHRVSWRSADMVVAKVWEFKDNYRNSPEIARLAIAITKMPYYSGVLDLVAPTTVSAAGPRPALVSCSSQEVELNLVTKLAITTSASRTVAIFVPKREDEDLIVSRLPLGAVRLHKDMNSWQTSPSIFYGTYHSAKGLEFDTVILPFLTRERFPDPDDVEALGVDDARSQAGRLLYVGCTRARKGLIMTHTGTCTDLLPADPTLVVRSSR